MNVQILHEGDNISSSVISYERSHNICTGIGQLNVVISKTVSRTFDPWDSIDIYESGDFKCRYFVSEVSNSDPTGTLTIDAQDNSKRLVDYFIPDSYIIEEPSYTRYWIELFLDEAGVSYSFATTSQGNLLSNFTSLGLTQAYEQILTLLQMSGWYMYFDGNGIAIIGDLNKEFSPVDDSFSKSEILEISVKKDDKMLRNRALVLGNYDPLLAEQIVADVSVRTKWNYDENDLRTVVIANSNIPNVTSAFGMANQLLKEFCRITIEKHLTVTGARNLQVGDVVSVSSNVFTGKGLVTTFGTSMGREGLVTNLILDQRCPRLFGFFDFGDYVYVGTYGDGIWRKHIRFDPNWYDFSDGLTELRITDLHINNGLYSAVGASGQMFYNLADDSAWQGLYIESLESSLEDEIETTSGIVLAPFSGIMARATMVDKELGRFVYGVDNGSGLNMGDYYLTLSGFYNTSFSGIVTSSGRADLRGWVVAYNIASGFSTYEQYPISVENNYKIMVLDVENDGSNDYVSVGVIGSGILQPNHIAYSVGNKTTQPFQTVQNSSETFYMPVLKTFNDEDIVSISMNNKNQKCLLLRDNEIAGIRQAVFVSNTNKLVKYDVYWDEFGPEWDADLVESAAHTEFNLSEILAIFPDYAGDFFTIYYRKSEAFGNMSFYTVVWNSIANTFSTDTLLYLNDTTDTADFFYYQDLTINNISYTLSVGISNPGTVGSRHFSPSHIRVKLIEYNGLVNTITNRVLMEFDTEKVIDTEPDYYFFPNISSGSSSHHVLQLFQNNDSLSILGWVDWLGFYYPNPLDLLTFTTYCKGFSFAGTDSSIDPQLLYEEDYFRFENCFQLTEGFSSGQGRYGKQLTSSVAFIGVEGTTGSEEGFIFNGTSFIPFIGSADFNKLPERICTINSNIIGGFSTLYLAKDTSNDWYVCDATTMEVLRAVPEISLVSPEFMTLVRPIGTMVKSFGNFILFGATYFDGANSYGKLIPFDFLSFNRQSEITLSDSSIFSSSWSAFLFGNFIAANSSANLGKIRWIDFGLREDSGISFMVLQREGEDFNVVQRAGWPIRIDVSNYAPLLTVQHVEATFNSFYIYGNEVTQIQMPMTFSGVLNGVNDYRYTLIPGSGDTYGSGYMGLTRQGIFVRESTIYSLDVEVMSGVQVLHEIDVQMSGVSVSGMLNCIESTNYAASGQYMFVTTSGDNPMFYQKDAESDIFVYYSGLPVSRATIIRIDDFL